MRIKEIYCINPNSGKYFKDTDRFVSNDSMLHFGTYNHTPIYPLYTFQTSNRFSSINHECIIEYYTMIPIKKFFSTYLVEVKFKYILNIFDKDSQIKSYYEFDKFCKNSIKTININKLINE